MPGAACKLPTNMQQLSAQPKLWPPSDWQQALPGCDARSDCTGRCTGCLQQHLGPASGAPARQPYLVPLAGPNESHMQAVSSEGE